MYKNNSKNMLAHVLWRSSFSNMVSFRYVSVVLNFFHDIFCIKFYKISSLRSFRNIFYNFFYWWETLKYFIFHEMTLKLYFVKCPERKISQCILPLRTPISNNICFFIDSFMKGNAQFPQNTTFGVWEKKKKKA